MGRTIVLSDLHLCPPNTHQLFTADAALAAFIGDLVGGPPTELILAGDVFDFLMARDYTAFEPDTAVARLHAILRAHLDVLDALRAFAGCDGHRITLLSGNHDPEVALPPVHAAFAKAVGSDVGAAERLRESGPDGPAVFGRAIWDEDAPIWVVHGDRWDDQNHIDIEALRNAAATGERFGLPDGSHLVMDLVRPLVNEGGYHWAPHLKPEIETVISLLLYLDPQRVMAFLNTRHGLTARLARNAVRAALGRSPLLGGEKHAPAMPPLERAWAAVAESIEGDTAAELAELEKVLRHGWAPPAPGALAGHDGLRKRLLRRWLERARAHDRTLDPAASDEISERAPARLPPHVSALVAGHTHGPRARGASTPAYFNSGTWIPTGSLPAGDLEHLIDRIERGELPLPPAPCTYVQIDGPKVKDIQVLSWGSA